MNERKQISGGLILSYVLIAINSLYGLFVTPFILNIIGTSDYGVYKTIASFSSSLAIVDLGIGSTVMRYISYFRASSDKRTAENYSAMALCQGTGIVILLGIIAYIAYSFIPTIFSSKFTDSELEMAKLLFVVLIINMCFNVFENIFFGIISGNSKFVFANTVKLLRILMRICMIIALLSLFKNAVAIVAIELSITVLVIIIEFIFVVSKLNLKIKLYYFDKSLFRESLGYSILLFIQAVVVQFNGNIDNIIIASLVGSGAVAVYSIGLQFFSMFEHFAMAFSNLMLPFVTEQVVNNASNEELENTVIKVGRYQFIFLGAVLIGFIVLGKNFISLWVGDSFLDAWKIGVILMVPTMIPLIQNVCLSILRAKNKLAFRTYALTTMAVINLLITYFGVKYFGYIAAAIGTAIGLVCANIVAMNIYYYKVLKIDVFRIFKGVFNKTWICILTPGIVIAITNHFIGLSAINLILQILLYIVIYIILLLFIGLNNSEKNMVKRMLKK